MQVIKGRTVAEHAREAVLVGADGQDAAHDEDLAAGQDERVLGAVVLDDEDLTGRARAAGSRLDG